MFRLVKAGYGSYNEVREFDARTVLRMIQFEGFQADYEAAWLELNKS